MADDTSESTPSQDELKAKMRAALDRKRGAEHPDDRAGSKEKAHGSEVLGGAGPQLHRRKAGGGGS